MNAAFTKEMAEMEALELQEKDTFFVVIFTYFSFLLV